MTDRRWTNKSQPQTLQGAVILLYINAVLAVVSTPSLGSIAPLSLVIVAGDVAGAYGIANEKKWGYYAAIAVAMVPFVFILVGYYRTGLFELLFQIVLVALLLHSESRDYQRIWFK